MRSEPGSGPTPPAAAGRCSPEAPGCRSWGGKSPQLDSVHRGRQRQRKQPQRFPPPPRRHCSCRVSARPARFCSDAPRIQRRRRPAAPVRSAGEKQGGSGGRSRKQPGRRGSGRPAPLPLLCAPAPQGLPCISERLQTGAKRDGKRAKAEEVGENRGAGKAHLKPSAGRDGVKAFPCGNSGGAAGSELAGMALFWSAERGRVSGAERLRSAERGGSLRGTAGSPGGAPLICCSLVF